MDKLKKALPFIIPPLAVLLIMGFAFYRHGLYPFGDGTVSWCDMSQQVIPLLTDFKDIFTGKEEWTCGAFSSSLSQAPTPCLCFLLTRLTSSTL